MTRSGGDSWLMDWCGSEGQGRVKNLGQSRGSQMVAPLTEDGEARARSRWGYSRIHEEFKERIRFIRY